MALFDNINIGQFIPQDSVVHQLDPRTKILMILVPAIFAALTLNLLIYAILLSFLLLIFSLSKLPLSLLIRNLKSFIWLFILIFILQVIFTSAFFEVIYYFGFFHFSAEGLLNGLTYSLRLTVFVLGAVVLSLTTSPMDLSDGMVKSFFWLKKLRFPIQELGLVTMISLRFVPLLVEEAANLRKAQLSRGASFEGNLIQRTRKTLPLLVPLFVSSFRKADELALALDARGFRSGQKRSSYRKLEFKDVDYMFLVITLVLCILCLLIKRL
jgi:energy-coupling factor transport system permease protein